MEENHMNTVYMASAKRNREAEGEIFPERVKRRRAHESPSSKAKAPASDHVVKDYYSNLDPLRQESRVLHVEPGSGVQPIHCSLQQVSLSDKIKPAYETTSYVWGEQSERGLVYLDGYRTDVPASAEVVLRRLRLPEQRRTLWIDSICIQQQKVVERNQQVAFMNEIYSEGSKNLIWLGEDDGYTEKALSDIQRLVENMRSETNDFKNLEDVLYDNDGARKYSSTQLGVQIPDWSALLRFYSSTWFSRLWIVQEAALSRENVCHRGSFEFALQDVVRAALWVVHKWPRLGMRFPREIELAATVGLFADQMCGIYNIWPKSKPSVRTLLSELQDFDTADPRDHVYGALGLLRKYTREEEIPLALLPKYEAPLAEVFRDAAKFVIARDGRLSALRRVSHRLDDDNLEWPSWVPRWDRKFDESKDAARWRRSDFKASNGVALTLPLLEVEDANILPLAGIAVDSISNVTPVMRIYHSEDTTAKDEFFGIIKPGIAMVQKAKRHKSKMESERALACTLIASSDIDGDCVKEVECMASWEAYRGYIATSRLPPPMYDLSKTSSELEIMAAAYRETMRDASDLRCLFLTESELLGIGPPTTKAGDTVVVLYGSRMPLVLRPLRHSGEATHAFVGSCYVHGIMDGEAVQAHRAQGKEDEVFYLR